MKACFMGLGYIGLPTAIIAAKHGVDIAGVDINAQVVEVTNQGKLHIIEPGMEEMLREVLASGHFKAYTEPRVSDAYFMVVPTPFKGDHEPDVSFVESATRMVLPLLKEGDLYVIESTSPVCLNRECRAQSRRGKDSPHLSSRSATSFRSRTLWGYLWNRDSPAGVSPA